MSNFVSPLLHLTRINGNSTDFGDTQLKRATEINCFNERPEWFVTCHTITNKKKSVQNFIERWSHRIECNVWCWALSNAQPNHWLFLQNFYRIYLFSREWEIKRTRINFAFTFAFAFNLNVFSLISHEFVTRVPKYVRARASSNEAILNRTSQWFARD